MNRREAITGSAALAVGSLLPGTNLSNAQDLKDDRVSLSTVTVVDDDPDVDRITIQVRLKKGKTVPGSDSFLCERVLLKHIGTNLIPWFKYCRDHGMKTL